MARELQLRPRTGKRLEPSYSASMIWGTPVPSMSA